MYEEIAGANKLQIFLEILGGQSAGAVFQPLILFVAEHTIDQHLDFFLIRVELEIVFLCEFFNGLAELCLIHLYLGLSADLSGFLGCDLDIGVFCHAGRADFWWFDSIVDVVAYKAPPVFFHFSLYGF
jgi:hypothetical protein